MTGIAATYSLGGSQVEKQRLLAQAAGYRAQVAQLLDRIGVRPGSRAVDVGCGPIGILDLLSERVGPHGSVVGVEREPLFCEMAHEEISSRGLANVEIVQGDALRSGLERQSFDLVHERLVLPHVPDRERFVAEMLALLRPGGTIVLEDIDWASWVCHPRHPSWEALKETFLAALRSSGGDSFVGRRHPELLRAAGARDIQTRIDVGFLSLGDLRRTELVSLIGSMRSRVLGLGLMSDTDLDAHRDALLGHLANPSTTVIDKLFVQSWGRKSA
jgi:SAM-dependent methyltransferase